MVHAVSKWHSFLKVKAGATAQRHSVCLARMRPEVQCPALPTNQTNQKPRPKAGCGGAPCNLTLVKMEARDLVFRRHFSYRAEWPRIQETLLRKKKS